jgi:hypothetical protein
MQIESGEVICSIIIIEEGLGNKFNNTDRV